MLLLLNILPLIGVFFVLVLPKKFFEAIRFVGLFFSILVFAFSVFIWLCFDKLTTQFQFVYTQSWLFDYNWDFIIGVDGISILFIVLTSFIFPFCLLASWKQTKNLKLFVSLFLLLEFFLLNAFSVLDLLFFYIFFESVLMPMFLIIGIWGSGSARIKAAYYFFFFTLVGSLFFLIAIFLIYINYGTTNFLVLLNSEILHWKTELFLFLSLSLGFAVKVPMFPFHIWLPEAHVQAPTEGSVILASLLLKLGGYGFLRVLIPMFPKAVVFFSPIFFLLGICGVVYCSLTSIVQVDLKKLVAYSSVAHMSMVVLGLFSLTHQGLQGALFLMLAHGISSSALFFLVGFLYDRHHTRSIYYYGGLVQPMPVFVLFFMIFLFANVSFPGTANFVGELLLFVGVFEFSPWVAFFAGFSIVLSTIYSFWIFNRIAFLNLKHSRITKFRDLSRIEVHTLFLFVFLVVFLGVYPDIALDTTYFSIKNLVFVLENN